MGLDADAVRSAAPEAAPQPSLRPPSASPRRFTVPGEVHYRVRVFTGDECAAGTDAHVWCQLAGTHPEHSPSPRLALDSEHATMPGERFQCGQVDEFLLRCQDVGEVRAAAHPCARRAGTRWQGARVLCLCLCLSLSR